MNELEKFKPFAKISFFMGHQVTEFRDNMIESSRTLEYQSSSHSFARNTATDIR